MCNMHNRKVVVITLLHKFDNEACVLDFTVDLFREGKKGSRKVTLA